jgi:hypothetical protein
VPFLSLESTLFSKFRSLQSFLAISRMANFVERYSLETWDGKRDGMISALRHGIANVIECWSLKAWDAKSDQVLLRLTHGGGNKYGLFFV